MRPNDLRNLTPPLTEARLARQYEAIRAHGPAASARRRAWPVWAAAGASLVVAASAAVWAHVHRAEAVLVDGAVIESPAAGDGAHGTSITLADGSRVELGASARARLSSARATSIRIDLERGSIDVEATHVEGRTFEVAAGAYAVHVVGTHFTVDREPGDRVTVRVDRGVVEIVSAANGESRRLGAGEQWSAPAAGTVAASAASPPVEAPAPPVEAPAPQESPRPQHEDTAKELFDEAQRARASGRPEEAAHAFDRLRRAYPHDGRAALSALELGRLRLDVLGDPRGAEEALRNAIALGPSSPFREDAEARRVEALARMGDASGCAAARAAYLARWPNGTYCRTVEVACGDR